MKAYVPSVRRELDVHGKAPAREVAVSRDVGWYAT